MMILFSLEQRLICLVVVWTSKMKPSEIAKQHGINLTDIGLMIGKPTATLRNWAKDSPVLFEAVIIGCGIIKKQIDKRSE